MAKYCVTCGKELEEGASACKNCGAAVNGQPTPTAPTNPTSTVNNSAAKKGNVMAIVGLVVSIVSLVLCCGTLSWLSLIFSIIGISTAKKAEGQGKGQSIAGIIISGVGILLLIAVIVLSSLGTISWFDYANNKINDQWVNLSPYNSDYDSDYDYDYDNDDFDFDY